MPVTAERGILGRTAEAFRAFVRGYSQEDVDKLRRIFSGEITDKDREEYKNYRHDRIFRQGAIPYRDFPSNNVPIILPRTLELAREESQRLNGLPPEALDQEIRLHALNKAQRLKVKI